MNLGVLVSSVQPVPAELYAIVGPICLVLLGIFIFVNYGGKL